MKRVLSFVLAFAVVMSLSLGFGVQTNLAEDVDTDLEAEISWWVFPTFAQDDGNPAGTYEEGVIEAFNEKYPNITVKLETIDFTSGPEALVAAIEGGEAPDVLFDAPGRIIEYGKNGRLVSLDDLFTEEMIEDIDNEALINASKGDGTAYMYPLSSAPFYMVINKAMWEESGAMEFVNLEGTRTWTTEDFENALIKLKEAGMMPGTLFSQNQGCDQGTRAFITNLYGAKMANEDMTEYAINSEEGVKALETAQKWVEEGLLGNGVAYNGGTDIELFVGGTTSFTFCWGAATQKAQLDSLEEAGIETISLPFPSDDGEPELEYLVNGFGVFDNEDETKAKAAKALITFIADDEVWGPKNVIQSGSFPVRNSFGDLYEGDEEMALLDSWTQYYAPYYNTMDGFANMRAEWWNMLQALQNGGDAQELADTYVENSNAGMN